MTDASTAELAELHEQVKKLKSALAATLKALHTFAPGVWKKEQFQELINE